MADAARLERIEGEFSHVWMVRTFLKHCEEAESDEELREVHRELYDVMHALGPAHADGDAANYLKQARKKLTKLQRAAAFFAEIQPEVSGHTNFVMARRSLETAINKIANLLAD